MSDTHPKVYELPRACPTVARALAAAIEGNFELFRSCFLADNGKERSNELKKRYEEWQAVAKHYIYLIGQEACLSGAGEPGRAAVSIAPAGIREPRRNGTTSDLHPDVIFAEKKDGVWKLSLDLFDSALAQTMSNKASLLVYRKSDFSAEAIERDRQRYHAHILRSMQKRGASLSELVSKQEWFQLEDAGITMTNWNHWTNYYKARILDPPVVFDMRDPVELGFGDPLSACRSYLRALYLGDSRTLLKYADASGKDWLTNQVNVEEKATNRSYHVFSNRLTLVTMLLTATTTLNDKRYMLVFWRGQNAQNPQEGVIAFQNTVFVQENDHYLLTRDLAEGFLTALLPLAGANAAGLLKYETAREMLPRSALPKHFYLIE